MLAEPTVEMRAVRAQLTDAQGRCPCRRTWERRLAIDATTVHARGRVWHKKHREAGVVPHTSIDTEAGSIKSGWHGWVYGWVRHEVA